MITFNSKLKKTAIEDNSMAYQRSPGNLTRQIDKNSSWRSMIAYILEGYDFKKRMLRDKNVFLIFSPSSLCNNVSLIRG